MAETDVVADAGIATGAPPPITSSASAATSTFDPQKAKTALSKAAHDEQRELQGVVSQQGRLSKGYLDWMQNRIQAEGATIEEAKHGWNTQQELQKRETSLWEDFGSPAFIAAMIGSAFSARPMNSALMAGGAALNAIKQNQTADYEKAFEAWKANSELAVKRMNMEHQQIQDIAHLAHTSIAEYQAALRGIAAKYENAGMIALMDAGHFDKVEEIIAKMPVIAEKVQEATSKLNLRKAAQDLVNETDEYKKVDLQKKFDMLLDAEKKIREAQNAGKYRTGSAAQDAKLAERKRKVSSIVNQIDAAMKIMEKNPDKNVVGIGGAINRGREFVFGGGSEASEFEQLIRTIQMGVKPAISGTTRLTKDDQRIIDTIVPGLGVMKNKEQVFNELAKLKKILNNEDLLVADPTDLSHVRDEEIMEELKRRGEGVE